MQLINARRRFLAENSIEDWTDSDTIVVMQQFLKEAKMEASKISSNAVLKVTKGLPKNNKKEKPEVAVCHHEWSDYGYYEICAKCLKRRD